MEKLVGWIAALSSEPQRVGPSAETVRGPPGVCGS